MTMWINNISHIYLDYKLIQNLIIWKMFLSQVHKTAVFLAEKYSFKATQISNNKRMHNKAHWNTIQQLKTMI